MCGIFGIIGPEGVDRPAHWAASESFKALLTLQHRGQDGAGILSYGEKDGGFCQKKDLGSVDNIFNEDDLLSLPGNMAIAHTRYATVGSDQRKDLQPMVMGFPFGIGMVHNGNLVNYHKLGEKLSREWGVHFISNNDLEFLLYIWCRYIQKSIDQKEKQLTFQDILRGAKGIVEQAKGGYALCGMMVGVGLFGMRDPHGIRPVVLGRRKLEGFPDGRYDYCLSSETKTLSFLGFDLVKDLEPGEVVLIDTKGELHSANTGTFKKSFPCMFEWVYFAGAESTIMNKDIYTSRLNLGVRLADKIKKLIDEKTIAPDIVCPVPETARTASISLAEILKIPYREGLIKNRYVQRSFILGSQKARENAVHLKLSPVRSEVEGKNILLVDDSLVRGTTVRRIVTLLKKFGAKEITLGLTCPPLRYPCYYGIDFPVPGDLLANKRDVEEIARWVGANRVIYLDEEDLKKAIGLDSMCMACVNNKYPTPREGAEEFSGRRNEFRGGLK